MARPASSSLDCDSLGMPQEKKNIILLFPDSTQKSSTTFSHICLLSLSNHTLVGFSNWDSSYCQRYDGSWSDPLLSLIRVLRFLINAAILLLAFTKLFMALAA